MTVSLALLTMVKRKGISTSISFSVESFSFSEYVFPFSDVLVWSEAMIVTFP
jgi:hypothetical protein